MERSAIRGVSRVNRIPDFAALHPGYEITGSERQLNLLRRQPPAGAGNFLRGDSDVLFEPNELPVAGRMGEGEAGCAGEAEHGIVGAQRIAEQPVGADGRGAAFQVAEQSRADAMALPAVV